MFQYDPRLGYEVQVVEDEAEFEKAKAFAKKMQEAADAFNAEFLKK